MYLSHALILFSFTGCVYSHPGRDLGGGTACPYNFITDGAAPAYVAQNDGFVRVTCEFNAQKCEVPNSGSQGLQTNIYEPCLEDVAPEDMTCEEVATSWVPACQDQDPEIAAANLADGFKCGCMSNKVQDDKFCQRYCAVCSPIFVNSQGYRSGTHNTLDPENDLAHGVSSLSDRLPRKKCEPYDVAAVADAVRSMHTPDHPVLGSVTLDIPPTVDLFFNDAIDYNKWSGTGGADGRLYNHPTAWYGESRTVNGGLVCPQKLMGYFKDTSLSPGDAIVICSMVSVELSGGPKFEDFAFEPGRVAASGVAQDGLIPTPLGNNKSLRDFYYRAGLDDVDIVALMGAHTLGGGQNRRGSYVNPEAGGFTGAFTLNPDVFSNDYFQNLIAYENVTDYGCNYFAPGVTPAMRENGGCHPTNQSDAKGGIMQIPTDRALLLDEGLRKYVVQYANDMDAFFKQFAKSAKRLSELGRDISVQWCNYDQNYTEPLVDEENATATETEVSVDVDKDKDKEESEAELFDEENDIADAREASPGTDRKLASITTRLVSAALRLFGY